ncbi:MAG: hypothetical protein EOO38_14485, partial [Cytophagaceae bacterium]
EEIANLLVEKGADLKSVNSIGSGLYSHALGDNEKQKEKIIWMLEHGADIYALSSMAFEDVQSAVDMSMTSSGCSEEARKLVVAKADIKRRDIRGETVLFTAVRATRIEVVRDLLNRGADVNAQNADGDTPLHIAARLAYPTTYLSNRVAELISLLLDAGANANMSNGRGDLPLHVALRYKTSLDTTFDAQIDKSPVFPDPYTYSRSPMLASLIGKTDINVRDGSGLSPLLTTIMLRDNESRDLIQDKAPKKDSITTFFDAIANGDSAQVAKMLKAKRYLAFYRLPDGTTPLHIAAQWGTIHCAEELVKCGADINARDMHSFTPLHSTLMNPTKLFMRRAITMTSFLLNHGAAVNMAIPSGDAPLHLAAKMGDKELCNLLLDKGAAINARGSHGDTALFVLTNPSTDLAFYKSLLARGADVNARGYLLSQDVPSGFGWNLYSNAPLGVNSSNASSLNTVGLGTPLHRAVLARRSNLVTALLEAGANLEAVDTRGQTPLTFAILTYSGSNNPRRTEGIIPLLLSKGANPNGRVEGKDLASVVTDIGDAE